MVMLFGSALPPFRPSLLVTLAILVLVPIECAVSSSPPILKHSATASSGVEYFGETFPEKQYSKRMRQLREETRGMFYHAYDNYRAHAFPWDELKPLSCEGRRWDRRDRGTLDDSLGGFSTTLVDALDMLEKPVSASDSTGTPDVKAKFFNLSSNWSRPTMPTSGTPESALVPPPDKYKA